MAAFNPQSIIKKLLDQVDNLEALKQIICSIHLWFLAIRKYRTWKKSFGPT
jgi:hypothetical protein